MLAGLYEKWPTVEFEESFMVTFTVTEAIALPALLIETVASVEAPGFIEEGWKLMLFRVRFAVAAAVFTKKVFEVAGCPATNGKRNESIYLIWNGLYLSFIRLTTFSAIDNITIDTCYIFDGICFSRIAVKSHFIYFLLCKSRFYFDLVS